MDGRPFTFPAPDSPPRQSTLGPLDPVLHSYVPPQPSNRSEDLSGSTATAQMAGNRQIRPAKRKRVACKECRQAKLRCDASTNASGICSHCRHLGRVCQVDTSYKRISRRLRVEELAAQVQHLRSVVVSGQTAAGSPPEQNQVNQTANTSEPKSIHESIDVAGKNVSSASPSQVDAVLAQTPRSLPLINGMVSPPTSETHHFFKASGGSRTIDHVSIKELEINELFQIFFERYHPYLNIMDPSLSPDDYHDKSPLLFWAIISVAARRYDAEPTLISSLAPPFMKMLWTQISILPHKACLVKAILLLCTWPFPTSSMWTDPSFTLLSVAKTAAMQLGLHRPEVAQDFNRQKTHLSGKDIQESIKIWAGCYITAQSIAVSIGQQPLINFDWAIDRACELGNVYTLPDDLRYSLLIQQFSVRICQVMSENRQSMTGLPAEGEIGTLLAMLETELESLQKTLGKNLSAIHEIMLTYAALQLRIFYFFERSKSEIRREGLLRAFSTSMDVISMLGRAKENYNVMHYAPSHFGRIIIVASTVILKVLHSSFAQFVDFEAGKRSFNSTLSLLRNASIENNDLHGRSSKILAQLWSFHSSLTPKNDEDPNLKLKSRSSASVLHDALWVWRERFGKEAASYIALAESTPQDGMSPTSIPMLPTTPRAAKDPGLQQDMEQSYGTAFDFGNMSSIWDSNLPLLIPIDFDGRLGSFDMPMS